MFCINYHSFLNQYPFSHPQDELKNYKKEQKHTNVPKNKPKTTELQRGWTKELGSWVDNQRQFYKNNKLSEDRVDQLNEIGFVWNLEDVKWQLRYVSDVMHICYYLSSYYQLTLPLLSRHRMNSWNIRGYMGILMSPSPH